MGGEGFGEVIGVSVEIMKKGERQGTCFLIIKADTATTDITPAPAISVATCVLIRFTLNIV